MACMRRAYQRAASSTSSIGGILSRPSPSALNANDQGLLFALELFPKHATHPYLFSAMTGMFVQAHQIPKDQMLTSGMPADEVLEGARQSLARVQELLAEGDTDGLKGLTGNRLHDLLSEHQKESAWLGLYGKQLEMKCEGSPMSNLFATFFMTHDPTPMSSFVDTPLGVSGWDGVTKAFMDRFVGPLLLWGHRAVGGHMRVAVKEQRRVLLAGKGAGGPDCAPLALTSKRYGFVFHRTADPGMASELLDKDTLLDPEMVLCERSAFLPPLDSESVTHGVQVCDVRFSTPHTTGVTFLQENGVSWSHSDADAAAAAAASAAAAAIPRAAHGCVSFGNIVEESLIAQFQLARNTLIMSSEKSDAHASLAEITSAAFVEGGLLHKEFEAIKLQQQQLQQEEGEQKRAAGGSANVEEAGGAPLRLPAAIQDNMLAALFAVVELRTTVKDALSAVSTSSHSSCRSACLAITDILMEHCVPLDVNDAQALAIAGQALAVLKEEGHAAGNQPCRANAWAFDMEELMLDLPQVLGRSYVRYGFTEHGDAMRGSSDVLSLFNCSSTSSTGGEQVQGQMLWRLARLVDLEHVDTAPPADMFVHPWKVVDINYTLASRDSAADALRNFVPVSLDVIKQDLLPIKKAQPMAAA